MTGVDPRLLERQRWQRRLPLMSFLAVTPAALVVACPWYRQIFDAARCEWRVYRMVESVDRVRYAAFEDVL